MAMPSFAHLLGRDKVKAAKSRAEDTEKDEEKDEREERDEDEKGDAKRAESDAPEKKDDESEDDKKDAKGKKAKAKKAKADDDDGSDSDDEGDDEPGAKAEDLKDADDEDGGDAGDGADMKKRGSRAARLRERARCAAIFGTDAAATNPALAAQLAFATDLPRTAAIAVLTTGALTATKPAVAVKERVSLDVRMAAVQVPAIGAGDAAPNESATLADQILAAGRKRRAESV